MTSRSRTSPSSGFPDGLQASDSRAADIALVVEGSDSSLSGDRAKKLPAYAKGRIPVYWIINLKARQVEVFSRPGKKGYRSHKSYSSGQQVPVVIDGRRPPGDRRR